jgi:hypothetical protein
MAMYEITIRDLAFDLGADAFRCLDFNTISMMGPCGELFATLFATTEVAKRFPHFIRSTVGRQVQS